MTQRTTLSESQLVDLLIQLTGEIKPVGETYTDDARFDNLLKLQEVVSMLFDEIAEVRKYYYRPEGSMHRAGEQTCVWLKEMQIRLNHIVAEYEGDNNEA